jgi:hypothetical protein
VGERCFAEAGRACQQDVVQRFAAFPRRAYKNLEILGDFFLAGEIGK